MCNLERAGIFVEELCRNMDNCAVSKQWPLEKSIRGSSYSPRVFVFWIAGHTTRIHMPRYFLDVDIANHLHQALWYLMFRRKCLINKLQSGSVYLRYHWEKFITYCKRHKLYKCVHLSLSYRLVFHISNYWEHLSVLSSYHFEIYIGQYDNLYGLILFIKAVALPIWHVAFYRITSQTMTRNIA